MLMLFGWLEALYMQASFWGWVITVFGIIVIVNSLIGFIVVIVAICKLFSGRRYPKKSASGLNRKEQKWLFEKK